MARPRRWQIKCPSPLEEELLGQIRLLGLPEPTLQFHFAWPRRWCADFAYPVKSLLIEVEGGVWIRGRHLRPKGFTNDMDKYNAATQLGWRVLRFGAEQIRSGAAVALIERMLRG